MTSPVFANLPRPALTADEAAMIQENINLDRLIMVALDSQEWDDAQDLMARKLALEGRFHASRDRTWRTWIAQQYPLETGGTAA